MKGVLQIRPQPVNMKLETPEDIPTESTEYAVRMVSGVRRITDCGQMRTLNGSSGFIFYWKREIFAQEFIFRPAYFDLKRTQKALVAL